MTEPSANQDSPEIERLLIQVTQGNEEAKSTLFSICRPVLTQMAKRRLNGGMNSRVDPSDIVQEAMIVATRDFPAYLQTREVPFLVWMYRLTWQRLQDSHRTHLVRKRRTVAREERFEVASDDSSVRLADKFVDSWTGPLSLILRQEKMAMLRETLDAFNAEYRELLCLKYLEGLTLMQVASVLGITHGAAKMRHLRALESLRNRIKSLD